MLIKQILLFAALIGSKLKPFTKFQDRSESFNTKSRITDVEATVVQKLNQGTIRNQPVPIISGGCNRFRGPFWLLFCLPRVRFALFRGANKK